MADPMPSRLSAFPDLEAANRSYNYAQALGRGEGHKGLLARLRDRLHAVWRPFWSHDRMVSYLAAETEFHASVVRCLNEMARIVDERQALRRDDIALSVDTLTERLQRIEENLRAEFQTAHGEVSGASAALDSRLQTVEAVVAGLEAIIARISRRQSALPAQDKPAKIPDYRYLLLENRYRGEEAAISEKLAQYAALFSGSRRPVLEIGAGRGELQLLFREAGVPAYGLELDEAMAEACAEKGLDVRIEDGLSHLAALADGSLGGIIAVQVIEHLPHSCLEELLRLSGLKTAPGSRVVFETINTASVAALSHNYFRDPSHVRPLHPDTMRYLMELSGFRIEEIRLLSPFPPGAVLEQVTFAPYMTPRWAEALAVLNRNIERLNRLLFGYQDYCIIALSPGS